VAPGAVQGVGGYVTVPSAKPHVPLAGRWHLVAAGCPDKEIQSHRVDIVFCDEPAGPKSMRA